MLTQSLQAISPVHQHVFQGKVEPSFLSPAVSPVYWMVFANNQTCYNVSNTPGPFPGHASLTRRGPHSFSLTGSIIETHCSLVPSVLLSIESTIFGVSLSLFQSKLLKANQTSQPTNQSNQPTNQLINQPSQQTIKQPNQPTK